MAGGEKLNWLKEKAVVALLSCPTIQEAAAMTGVSEITMHRWLKEDEFKVLYHEARRE